MKRYPQYDWNPSDDDLDDIDFPTGDLPEDDLPDITDDQF